MTAPSGVSPGTASSSASSFVCVPETSFGYGVRPSPSACIWWPPARLVPDGVASVLWPPCSLLGVPSLRSAGLLPSWETCRLFSLLPQVSLSCSSLGSRLPNEQSEVQTLGSWLLHDFVVQTYVIISSGFFNNISLHIGIQMI